MGAILHINCHVIYVSLSRQHNGAEQCHVMQTFGHQVVGRNHATHEDVRLMYEKFFGGEAVSIKRALKKKIGLIPARKLLSNIFQVAIYTSVRYCRTCILDKMYWFFCILYFTMHSGI